MELLWENTIEITVPMSRKGGKACDSAGLEDNRMTSGLRDFATVRTG